MQAATVKERSNGFVLPESVVPGVRTVRMRSDEDEHAQDITSRRVPGFAAMDWLLGTVQAGCQERTRKTGRASYRAISPFQHVPERSEERRVGKECRSRWS